MVDMSTFKFNYMLWKVSTQTKNLPLPTCIYIIPMMYSWWNCVKGGSDMNTQMLWDSNFITPIKHPHYAVVKQLAILQPFYMIHKIGQMVWCQKDLEEFTSLITYRKYI